jgi:predicted RNA-binding Zn-ribbon protein involved in translation (DUF1610 family)
MPNEALVATLRLLFSGYDRGTITASVNEVMILPERERRRLICPNCGSEDLTFQADITWSSDNNRFETSADNVDNCWCISCDGEIVDQEVIFDYVHPNKSLDETHG